MVLCLFLPAPHGLQHLSSLTRDPTWATAVKAPSPNHWTARELPSWEFFLRHDSPVSFLCSKLQRFRIVWPHGASGTRTWFDNTTTWMSLEDIMLSEISQSQKDKYCMISLM